MDLELGVMGAPQQAMTPMAYDRQGAATAGIQGSNCH
jgi:hypothetical protein